MIRNAFHHAPGSRVKQLHEGIYGWIVGFQLMVVPVKDFIIKLLRFFQSVMKLPDFS